MNAGDIDRRLPGVTQEEVVALTLAYYLEEAYAAATNANGGHSAGGRHGGRSRGVRARDHAWDVGGDDRSGGVISGNPTCVHDPIAGVPSTSTRDAEALRAMPKRVARPIDHCVNSGEHRCVCSDACCYYSYAR